MVYEDKTKKLFSQQDLEKLIAKRLRRERRNTGAFEEIRKAVDCLKKLGYINADSYADAAEELILLLTKIIKCENTREKTQGAASVADICDVCGGTGIGPEGIMYPGSDEGRGFDVTSAEAAAADLRDENYGNALGFSVVDSDFISENDLRTDGDIDSSAATDVMDAADGSSKEKTEKEIYGISVSGEASARDEFCGGGGGFENSCERRIYELSELCEKYGEVSPEKLLEDKAFIAYARGRDGSLTKLYEGYRRITSGLSELDGERSVSSDADCDGARKAQRAMASTAFSGRSASVNADAGFELSPLQRDIARRAGMSYREYMQLLREIPDTARMKRAWKSF